MNPKLKGYLLGALSAATYGLNPLFTLPLYADGLNADCVLLYRYVLASVLMAAMIRWRGRTFTLARRDRLPVGFMALMMWMSSLFLFESYNYMEAGIASTMLFVYPLMVAVIMALVFRERLSATAMICIFMALMGIALLFKRPEGATLSITGTAFVMLSSLSYAVYIIGVNRPGLRSVPTVKLVFYVLVIGSVLFGIKIALSGGTLILPSRWYMWGCVAALAILPTVISFICTTAAINLIGPTPTAILGALEPATAVVVGVTVFHESMTPRDWWGLLLIVSAVTMVVGGGQISAVLVHFRRLFPRIKHHRQ